MFLELDDTTMGSKTVLGVSVKQPFNELLAVVPNDILGEPNFAVTYRRRQLV